MSSTLYEFSSFFPHHNFLGSKDATKLEHQEWLFAPNLFVLRSENDYEEILNVFVMPVLHNYLELKLWRAEIS